MSKSDWADPLLSADSRLEARKSALGGIIVVNARTRQTIIGCDSRNDALMFAACGRTKKVRDAAALAIKWFNRQPLPAPPLKEEVRRPAEGATLVEPVLLVARDGEKHAAVAVHPDDWPLVVELTAEEDAEVQRIIEADERDKKIRAEVKRRKAVLDDSRDDVGAVRRSHGPGGIVQMFYRPAEGFEAPAGAPTLSQMHKAREAAKRAAESSAVPNPGLKRSDGLDKGDSVRIDDAHNVGAGHVRSDGTDPVRQVAGDGLGSRAEVEKVPGHDSSLSVGGESRPCGGCRCGASEPTEREPRGRLTMFVEAFQQFLAHHEQRGT